MKAYGVNELRKMFLDFFESKEHLAMKSFSLVPHNDNSLLLINAGTDIIRFVPSLIITKKDIDDMIVILDEAIKETI